MRDIVNPLESIVAAVNANPGRVRGGSLRIWGVWFGRPADNIHRVVKAACEANSLKFVFDEGEILAVGDPQGIHISEAEFRIERASFVNWEWTHYGSSDPQRDRHHLWFKVEDRRIIAATDWPGAKLNPLASEPAVDIG